MNGADVLCQTLLANGIDTCFANPGTSEMHFVAALDDTPRMRCVLGLFEGVVTGAADGYARMSDKTAATLLHTGPGLANGLANLHNARRARSSVLNIVGDHAAAHLPYDAPLTSDIEGLARPMSQWVGRVSAASCVQHQATAAIDAARQGVGQVATLVLPADTAWSDATFCAGAAMARRPAPDPAPTDEAVLGAAAQAVRAGRRCLLLLGGRALRRDVLAHAGRIAHAHSGVSVMAEQSNARFQQGRTGFTPPRVPYAVDAATSQLAPYDCIVLIGSRAPVAFFKFPGKPHTVTAEGAEILTLAAPDTDPRDIMAALADALGLSGAAAPALPGAPVQPADGALDAARLSAAIAFALPDNAIVCDEAISYSHALSQAMPAAAPHDLLQLTGGAIGIGPSLAVGAAIACPDRPVLTVQADGSALYTVQALWTQAREGLNVVTVILANRKYASLYGELTNLGRAAPGPNARAMLDIDGPAIDWVSLARGFGVPAQTVDSASALVAAIQKGFAAGGPCLIEARVV